MAPLHTAALDQATLDQATQALAWGMLNTREIQDPMWGAAMTAHFVPTTHLDAAGVDVGALQLALASGPPDGGAVSIIGHGLGVQWWDDEEDRHGCPEGVLCGEGDDDDDDEHVETEDNLHRDGDAGWNPPWYGCWCTTTKGKLPKPHVGCWTQIKCHGPDCDFVYRYWTHPCPPWWANLPACPPTIDAAIALRHTSGVRRKGKRVFCHSGPGGRFHPGAKACFREISFILHEPAQQCCYKQDGTLATEGAMAGTPDKKGTAYAADNNGDCRYDWMNAVFAHNPEDVIPFSARAAAYRTLGYSEKTAFEMAAKIYHKTHPPWGSAEARRQLAAWRKAAAFPGPGGR